MTKKVYRVCNWRQYNKSLVNRGSLTFWFSPEVGKQWENKSKTGKRGRSSYYADIAIQTALTIRQLYRLPLRMTEGLMLSLVELMGLKIKVPNYTTLSRRAATLKIDLGIQESKEARHVLIDSTGVQVIGEGEWKKLRHGESRYQLWRKLHITLDASNQMILSAKMTESVRLDGNYLRGLIGVIPGDIASITGDGAYDKQDCYRVAHERNAKPVFPPQHNACAQRNKIKKDAALIARDKVIAFVGRGENRAQRLKDWKEENNYHCRSLVETMMSRMKSIFGDKMRSRSYDNQATDLLIRCYAMNKMTQLGLPESVIARQPSP